MRFKKGQRNLSDFWDKHYLSFNENDSSPFCKEVISKYLKPEDYVIEIGCGNGRDGAHLAKIVHFYEGIDLSESAISSAKNRFIQAGISSSKYLIHQGDFSKIEFSNHNSNRIVIYSRFSLHSDTEESENALLSKLKQMKTNQLLVLIEVRTIYDELFGLGEPAGRNAFITDHYRRFVEPEEFRAKVSQDFELVNYQVSEGFAAYKEENPIVLRIAFQN